MSIFVPSSIIYIRGVYAKDSEIINSVLIICFTEIMGVLNLIRKIFTIRHHQQYILLCGSQRRHLGVLLRGRGQTKIISYLELNLESGFCVEVKEKVRK